MVTRQQWLMRKALIKREVVTAKEVQHEATEVEILNFRLSVYFKPVMVHVFQTTDQMTVVRRFDDN